MNALKIVLGVFVILFFGGWAALLAPEYVGWVRDVPRLWRITNTRERSLLVGTILVASSVALFFLVIVALAVRLIVITVT